MTETHWIAAVQRWSPGVGLPEVRASRHYSEFRQIGEVPSVEWPDVSRSSARCSQRA